MSKYDADHSGSVDVEEFRHYMVVGSLMGLTFETAFDARMHIVTYSAVHHLRSSSASGTSLHGDYCWYDESRSDIPVVTRLLKRFSPGPYGPKLLITPLTEALLILVYKCSRPLAQQRKSNSFLWIGHLTLAV